MKKIQNFFLNFQTKEPISRLFGGIIINGFKYPASVILLAISLFFYVLYSENGLFAVFVTVTSFAVVQFILTFGLSVKLIRLYLEDKTENKLRKYRKKLLKNSKLNNTLLD